MVQRPARALYCRQERLENWPSVRHAVTDSAVIFDIKPLEVLLQICTILDRLLPGLIFRRVGARPRHCGDWGHRLPPGRSGYSKAAEQEKHEMPQATPCLHSISHLLNFMQLQFHYAMLFLQSADVVNKCHRSVH